MFTLSFPISRLAKEEGVLPLFLICFGYSAPSVLSLEQRVSAEWDRSCSVCLLCEPVLHQAVNETLDIAVTWTRRPEFIWRVQPQQRCQLNLPRLCVTTVADKDWGLWKLHYIDIATPSLLQNNEVWSTRPDSDNICDTSDQLYLWRIQQLLLLWRNLGCKRRSEDCLL
jgi:hypothetical protein